MNTTKLVASAVLLAVLGSSSALAGDRTPGIDRREHRQYQRILKGVHHGQLNRRETHRLLRGQARVHRMERRAKADGNVTWLERARIRTEQTRQSRHIHRERHDWN
jgi:hypothetical protein